MLVTNICLHLKVLGISQLNFPLPFPRTTFQGKVGKSFILVKKKRIFEQEKSFVSRIFSGRRLRTWQKGLGLLGHTKLSKILVISFQMALAARGKIIKSNRDEPDEFERSISQALLDLEINSDLKAQLRELYITAAKEVDVASGKKAIVIFVPVPQLKAFQKVNFEIGSLWGRQAR